MIARLRNRIAKSEGEGGFTLIELLVVIIIIAILLAIAVPSYLKFRDRAKDSSGQANVRAAVPAMEACYADDGNYTNCNATRLKASYDAGLKTTGDQAITVTTTSTSYCISAPGSGGDNAYWKKAGPTADIAASTTACT